MKTNLGTSYAPFAPMVVSTESSGVQLFSISPSGPLAQLG